MTRAAEKRLIELILRSERNEPNALLLYCAIFDSVPRSLFYTMPPSKGQNLCRDFYSKFNLDKVVEHSVIRASRYSSDEGFIAPRYSFTDKIMVDASAHGNVRILYGEKTPKHIIDSMTEFLRGYYKEPPKRDKKPKTRSNIFMLSVSGAGLDKHIDFKPFRIKNADISIADNYNDDFLSVSESIIANLNEKNGKGIVVLHGDPGTGKTHYLRYLCQVLKKKVLYIPPSLVGYIVNPELLEVLKNHENSVLIIEDGDNVLRRRDDNATTQEVSTLLNISDGMLNDVLKLQIVATFNTALQNIDEAFMRQGRLIHRYEFMKLSVPKAEHLAQKLGFDAPIVEAMTIADVYNLDKAKQTNISRPAIGFAGKTIQPHEQ